jgi:hypothetical protein
MTANDFMVHSPVVSMLVSTTPSDRWKVRFETRSSARTHETRSCLGWRPSEFKSSRGERAEKRSYEPEDYMDKGVRAESLGDCSSDHLCRTSASMESIRNRLKSEVLSITMMPTRVVQRNNLREHRVNAAKTICYAI